MSIGMPMTDASAAMASTWPMANTKMVASPRVIATVISPFSEKSMRPIICARHI